MSLSGRFTRQELIASSRHSQLPQLEGSSIEKAARGGYVLVEAENADITIVSTGSEVCLCMDAVKKLSEKGLKVRVVSLPCWEVFKVQDNKYKLSVFPSGAPVLSVEAYSTFGWGEVSHEHFGLKAFGASGRECAIELHAAEALTCLF